MFDECLEDRLVQEITRLRSQLEESQESHVREVNFCNKLRSELDAVKLINKDLSRSYQKAMSDLIDLQHKMEDQTTRIPCPVKDPVRKTKTKTYQRAS